MRGRYFVMGRLLSPLDGVGPEDLRIGDVQLSLYRLHKDLDDDPIDEAES